MSHSDLLRRVRELRAMRDAYEPLVKKKAKTKAQRDNSSAIDKLLAGMSPEDKLALLKLMEEGGEAN